MTNLRTIQIGKHQQIQGVHIATLPNGRITVREGTKTHTGKEIERVTK